MIIVDTLKKIDAVAPVEWDRFTKTDDGFYVVYGWICRKDGQRDFVMVAAWEDKTADDVFFTTSSAKYSESICRALYGEDEEHNSCIKIEELYKSLSKDTVK